MDELGVCKTCGHSSGKSFVDFNNPQAVYSYCYPLMCNFDREHFWVLALNAKNQLLRRIECAIGTVDTAVVHPREVFKDAILASAVSIILVHNHPSGNTEPSACDKRLTEKLANAGDIMGIDVVDHVIMGEENRYYSMREHGLMQAHQGQNTKT